MTLVGENVKAREEFQVTAPDSMRRNPFLFRQQGMLSNDRLAGYNHRHYTALYPPIAISNLLEGLVYLPGHPQLIDRYRRVTVFRDLVLYPERRRRSGIFLAIRRSASGWQMERGH